MSLRMNAFLLCLLYQLRYSVVVNAATYDYSDPKTWGDTYPDCNLKSQSPIDLTGGTYLSTLEAPVFTSSVTNGAYPTFSIKNDIHAVQVAPNEKVFWVTFPGSTTQYIVQQLHFHFGKPETAFGSEHTVDGKAFKVGSHMVTKAVVGGKDKYAVFGTVYTIGDNQPEDRNLEAITETFQAIGNVTGTEGTAVNITGFNIRHLLPKDISLFYKYNGSFTTPPCTEGVDWTVFSTSKEITTAQFARFNFLKADSSGTPMARNYRPVQPLNGRIIYTSFPVCAGCLLSTIGLCNLVTVLVASLFLILSA